MVWSVDPLSPDIADLERQLVEAEHDAQALVAGLSEELGTWRAADGSWSVAQCLDHIVKANLQYLAPMFDPAERARERHRMRRGPAKPGLIGRFFVRTLEPPVKKLMRMTAPPSILPHENPALSDAFARFLRTQSETRRVLHDFSDLDLNAVHFRNPFIPGLRFSLATGFHVITAHERRHLWQAWRVRRAAEAV